MYTKFALLWSDQVGARRRRVRRRAPRASLTPMARGDAARLLSMYLMAMAMAVAVAVCV